MEKNKLADILEESLKSENELKNYPSPPEAPKGQGLSRSFSFKPKSEVTISLPKEEPSETVSTKTSIQKTPQIIETPKFSATKPIEKAILKTVSSTDKKINNPAFISSKGFKTGFKGVNENAPNILNEDEFEIDGMGEVWEYAGHSANVNQNEDSKSSSDEFDPEFQANFTPKVQKKAEAIKTEKNIQKFEEKKVAKKKIDLKTRGLQAEARIQQKEMKEKVFLEEKQEDPKDPIIIEAANEWDNISVKEIEEVKYEQPANDEIFYNRNITVDQIIEIVENIETESPALEGKKNFFYSFFSCFRVKTKSLSFLSAQRQKLLKFSKEEFKATQNFHVSMIKKIFRILKSSDNCPLIGEHWREIGFQGISPSTDLRKVGLFGLLCIFYFLEKYTILSTDIHKASINPLQKFPFASVCIIFSELALTALQENVLLKQIEKSERVYEVILDYFCGLMVFWFKYYSENKKTIMDIMNTKEYVKIYAKKHLNEIISLTKYRVN